ncbi:signal peptidase I [Pseudobutyrivibrio ruminis]|uniref:signal peptidase I n=1 Tax=Pseudobutyrivibrio ruminis TaxID=46206 RepID=UPI00068845C7
MKDVEDLSDFDEAKAKKDDDDNITKESLGKEVVSVIINVLVCFAIVFLITHFVGQRTVVSGSSMEDTLSDGDNLIVDKLSYRFHNPERYDVVVFPYQYEEDTYYIKRIIGLPGEVVNIDSDGTIYINGEPLDETYGTETILNSGLAASDILLGPDEYFVLGDNRNNSTDSRFEQVGNIHGSDIVGKAWVRVYPFNEFGLVDNIE